ncbi:Dyp-type peroxidase domain-containing protein [Streptomyces sp. NPDC047880]|uniref:Dyp-type peroxidase domain-containing protein n=1 Tax=Streptomyces sp. NPDC047880 TaxID=3155626 RepID=UPI003453228F
MAVAVPGTGGLIASRLTAWEGPPIRQDHIAAPLRGTAPLPHAHVISLHLVDGQGRLGALRAAHHAVAAIDGGEITAWLALGESALALEADRPRQLKQMPSFTGDLLDPARSHGDLQLQITGTSTRVTRQAAEQTLRDLPQCRVRWRLDGVRPDNRTEGGRGLARNPFHFTEGYGTPSTSAGVTERALIFDQYRTRNDSHQ